MERRRTPVSARLPARTPSSAVFGPIGLTLAILLGFGPCGGGLSNQVTGLCAAEKPVRRAVVADPQPDLVEVSDLAEPEQAEVSTTSSRLDPDLQDDSESAADGEMFTASSESVAEPVKSTSQPAASVEERLRRLEAENQQLRQRLDALFQEPPAQQWVHPNPSGQAGLTSSDGSLMVDPVSAAGGSAGGSTGADGKKSDKPANPFSMSATWKNGVEFESADKNFKFHIGGRTQIDMGIYAANGDVQFGPGGTGPIRDGVNFRRGRLRADGTMYEQIDWVVEYDFVNSAGTPDAVPAPTDGYFTFKQLPVVGNFRLGLQKEPIGFDHLVSSRYLSFMERSFNQDAFYGGFNNGFAPGATFFDNWNDECGTWWVGLYKVTTNPFQFNTGGGEYAFTSRVTWLPWYVEEGAGLLHLGASYRHAAMDDGVARYRTRGPERSGLSSAWPLFANTGFINGNGQDQGNLELAGVWGPLNIQGDYLISKVNDGFRTDPGPGDLFYHGGYIEALYFLTGEHRVYNKKSAVFERVTPLRNFRYMNDEHCDRNGWGAWQIGMRYNYLNLNSQGIDGGKLHDITMGLNWFLNPNLKIQWNYSVTQRTSVTRLSDGTIQGFGMRLAHDF